MIKLMKKFLFILIILFLVFLYTLYSLNKTTNYTNQDIEIQKGSSLNSISQLLKKEKFIKSSLFFRLISKKENSSTSFQAGHYNIPLHLSSYEIHNFLLKGPIKSVQEVKVTIKERLSLRETALELEKKEAIKDHREFISLATNKTFINSLDIGIDNLETLEGFLYPETYQFIHLDSAESVIKRMVNLFKVKMLEIDPNYRNVENLYEKIILASIIEIERRVEGEAPIMASVFYSRIEIGMPLQSDATVTYVKKEILNKEHEKRMYNKDYKIDSPYNTFINKGLPPTPITSPSFYPLKGAFFPAQTDYLYFVVNDLEKGTNEFNSDYEKHLQGRDKYVKKYFS